MLKVEILTAQKAAQDYVQSLQASPDNGSALRQEILALGTENPDALALAKLLGHPLIDPCQGCNQSEDVINVLIVGETVVSLCNTCVKRVVNLFQDINS